jgi:putative FmdB family regulatory protein
MPVYEYECRACGHLFEEWQKITDGPVKTCPKCKKKKVDRLISQTAFQLKGGGWYKDLYSSSSGGSKKDSDSGDSGGSDGKAAKAEAKSEKAEAKAESKSESKAAKSDSAKPAKATKAAK